MTDDEFLAAFEECRLVRTDWTHEAHIRMAWLYLMRVETKAVAFDYVRSGIQKLNATFIHRDQLENPNRPPKPKDPRGLDGYHETVTVAFVTVIASRVKPGEDFATFRARNPDLFDRTLLALLRHYSPERLYSLPARTEFLKPDLEPLPG
ncbi:hypothetical protein J8F10_35650 [Gemmata sp. G18]|uniref:Uncharacterized protein n=1 Tax=Gemmata palustris TaxID=2822762 RepID=A0ABS5C3Q1_9BACT|nr:hypothetical protein [Gemmata palustris]MBP3960589.1 hypothetical protein [Gemmata palustris]